MTSMLQYLEERALRSEIHFKMHHKIKMDYWVDRRMNK